VFTVTARNEIGTGSASDRSNAVTPSPYGPSSDTTPLELRLLHDGVLYIAEKQPNPDKNSYLFVLPFGSNTESLRVTLVLPYGASSEPPSGTSLNFSSTSQSYTITAQNGIATEDIEVTVRTAELNPAENPYFMTDPKKCEIVIDDPNPSGSLPIRLIIPFETGAEPARIYDLSAVITLPGTLSYNYAEGYLRIEFEASSLEALKGGSLKEIRYWLAGDPKAKGYVQTFPPLRFADILADTPPVDPPSSGGGGCSAGLVWTAALLVPILLLTKRKF
jgi:hypothetical protein